MSYDTPSDFVMSNGRELVLVSRDYGRIITMQDHWVTGVAESFGGYGGRSVDITLKSDGYVQSERLAGRDLGQIMTRLFHADRLSIEELLALVHRKMEERRP